MKAISDKIIKNTFFNTVGNFSTTFLYFLLLPYIMLKLGPERFGIWALTSVIFGLFTALDFGSGSAFVKFFSEYEAKKDKLAFNQVLVTGLLMMALFSGLSVLIFALLINKLLFFFHIPEQLFDEARFVFLGAGIFFAFNNTFGIFQAVIRGLQRMEISNSINVGGSIFYALGIFVFLEIGYGLKGLVIAQGIRIILINLVSLFCAKRLNKDLTFSFSFLKLEQLKTIFQYCLRMQISNIANLANLQTDKTLISFFLNLSYVAFYEVGQKISLFCKMLVNVLLGALVPAISELDSTSRQDSINKLYERGTKYLSAVAFPVNVFLLVCSSLFIRAWVGPGYDNSIMVVRLLVIGIIVNTLTGVGVMIVRGVGKPIYETRYAVISLILNVALGIILVKPYGFTGIVMATPISTIVGSLYFISIFHKLYSISSLEFIRKIYFKPFIVSMSLAAGVYSLNKLLIPMITIESRMDYIVLLLLDGLLFFVSFVFLLNKAGFWDKEDESLFVQKSQPYPRLHKLVSILVSL